MDMRVLARNDYILIAMVALSALAGVIALIVAAKSLWEVWRSRSEGPEVRKKSVRASAGGLVLRDRLLREFSKKGQWVGLVVGSFHHHKYRHSKQ